MIEYFISDNNSHFFFNCRLIVFFFFFVYYSEGEYSTAEAMDTVGEAQQH